jgi:hypothetical protein
MTQDITATMCWLARCLFRHKIWCLILTKSTRGDRGD